MGVDVFLPYLETTLTELADILQKVEYPEIETKLNDILGDIIIRAGPKVGQSTAIVCYLHHVHRT